MTIGSSKKLAEPDDIIAELGTSPILVDTLDLADAFISSEDVAGGPKLSSFCSTTRSKGETKATHEDLSTSFSFEISAYEE
jgi:hypothetical protein